MEFRIHSLAADPTTSTSGGPAGCESFPQTAVGLLTLATEHLPALDSEQGQPRDQNGSAPRMNHRQARGGGTKKQSC